MRQTRTSRCGKSEADKKRALHAVHHAATRTPDAVGCLGAPQLRLPHGESLCSPLAGAACALGCRVWARYAALHPVSVSAFLAAVLPAFALCVPLALCLPVCRGFTGAGAHEAAGSACARAQCHVRARIELLTPSCAQIPMAVRGSG
jgi:hypothetical protein